MIPVMGGPSISTRSLVATVVIAVILAGCGERLAKACPGHQQRVASPSRQSKQRASSQGTSSPGKQGEMSIEYRNAKYGFCFSLPESWRGFSIVIDRWRGNTTVLHGEVTAPQWRSPQREEFWVSAAPIGPTELGRNRRCVFALPARYNYAFPTGYEEVEQILRGNPLHACKARGDHR